MEPADLARVEIAFFSPDLFPAGVRSFFGATSRAPRLRWLHTMSAGVDNPIFDEVRAGGAELTPVLSFPGRPNGPDGKDRTGGGWAGSRRGVGSGGRHPPRSLAAEASTAEDHR